MEDSPYFRFGARRECVANVYGVKYEAMEGTNNETAMPLGGTIDALFHVQGRASRWPDVFPGDEPVVKFFSTPFAERLASFNFTGLEFHPVHLRMGNLRSLRSKQDQCPGYFWGRVTGVLLVDLFLNGDPWPVGPSGMFVLAKPPPGQYCDMKIRQEQPLATDFCRIVPGGTGYLAISRRVAEVLENLKSKDIIVGLRGKGFL